MQYDADAGRRDLYDPSVQKTLLSALDEKELNELCSRMIRARSDNPPGAESEVASIVAEWAKGLGGEVTFTEPIQGRPNVMAKFPGVGSAFSLAFSGHMDVVPVKSAEEIRWEQPPYGGKISNGELWGRGSVDMKGGLAAAMAAISALRRVEVELPGDLWLLASMDEELEMTGIKAMIESGQIDNIDATIVCEPTNLRVNCASKGRTWATLRVLGEPAHAGFKHGGVNAITNAVQLANRLEETAPGHLTRNTADESWWKVTEIEGGLGPAIVPDRCDLTLDARLVAGQTCDMVWDEIQQMIEQLASEQPEFHCEIHVVERREPWAIEAESQVATSLCSGLAAVKGCEPEFAEFPGTTDASFLVPAGIPCVICGPGDLSQAHRENERISLAELTDAAKSYALTTLEYSRLKDTIDPKL